MIQTQNRLVLLVIVSLGIILNIRYINEFPSHIHAWAQSDRYALAVGFTNNDLNFSSRRISFTTICSLATLRYQAIGQRLPFTSPFMILSRPSS